MAFSDEILNAASDKQALIRLDLKKRFEASEFISVDGVFAADWPFPVHTAPGATYNYSKRRLEQASAVTIDAEFYVLLTTGKSTYLPINDPGVPGQEDLWEGRLKVSPTITQDARDMLEGIVSTSTSSLNVINPDQRFNILLSEKVIVKDREVKTWFQVNGSFQLVSTTTTHSLGLSIKDLRVSIKQSLQKLRKKALHPQFPYYGDGTNETVIEPSFRSKERKYKFHSSYDSTPQPLAFTSTFQVGTTYFRPPNDSMHKAINISYGPNFYDTTSGGDNHRWEIESALVGLTSLPGGSRLHTIVQDSAVHLLNKVGGVLEPSQTATAHTMRACELLFTSGTVTNVEIGYQFFTPNFGSTRSRLVSGLVIALDLGGFRDIVTVSLFGASNDEEKLGLAPDGNSSVMLLGEVATFRPNSRWLKQGGSFIADTGDSTVSSIGTSLGNLIQYTSGGGRGSDLGDQVRQSIQRATWTGESTGSKRASPDPDNFEWYIHIPITASNKWDTVVTGMLTRAGVSYNAASFTAAAAGPNSIEARFSVPYGEDTTIKGYWEYIGGICANMGGFLKIKADGDVYFQFWDDTTASVRTFTDNDILQGRSIRVDYKTDDLITTLEVTDGHLGTPQLIVDSSTFQGIDQDKLVKKVRGYLDSYPKITTLTDILFTQKKQYAFSTYTQGLDLEIGDRVTIESKHLPDGKTTVDILVLKLTKSLNEVRIIGYDLS